MEWESKIFLSDDEIKIVAIFLAYGVGIGIFIGMFFNNIILFFSLGGVISIIASTMKIWVYRRLKHIK